MDLLQQEQARLEERYEADNAASLGLSPNLIVKDYEKFRPQVIRPTWLFILLGSITGLLGWFVFTFIMITRRGLSR